MRTEVANPLYKKLTPSARKKLWLLAWGVLGGVGLVTQIVNQDGTFTAHDIRSESARHGGGKTSVRVSTHRNKTKGRQRQRGDPDRK